MPIEKTSKGPGGRNLIVIPLSPRTLLKGGGVTVQHGYSPPGAQRVSEPSPVFADAIAPVPAPVRYYTASETHQGTRDYQQDALYVMGTVNERSGETATVFGVLCDGMGGMQSGGEASSLVVDEIRRELEALPDGANIAAFFREKIRRLDSMMSERFGDGAAGTTMVSVVAIEDKLYWCSIGDSRVYLIRGGEILQVTRDHNYYMELLEDVLKGRITQEEADNHPKKEALISFIGSGSADLIDANTEPFTLINGDIILLCSDGLTKSLADEEVRKLVQKSSYDLKEAARILINTAIDIDMNPKDNTSVILIQYIK